MRNAVPNVPNVILDIRDGVGNVPNVALKIQDAVRNIQNESAHVRNEHLNAPDETGNVRRLFGNEPKHILQIENRLRSLTADCGLGRSINRIMLPVQPAVAALEAET
uniref:hypothetical protein n=1 Tax=Candidatus Electronema sp. TaxID=2698783 RepID=UPI004056E514